MSNLSPSFVACYLDVKFSWFANVAEPILCQLIICTVYGAGGDVGFRKGASWMSRSNLTVDEKKVANCHVNFETNFVILVGALSH